MAKAVKKKSAKEASSIFHNIMKASMQPKKEIKSEGARQWYPYEHPTTGRTYVIRLFYTDSDDKRKCTVSLQSNNPKDSKETLIKTFEYPATRQDEVDERAKMIAIQDGDMQPNDSI